MHESFCLKAVIAKRVDALLSMNGCNGTGCVDIFDITKPLGFCVCNADLEDRDDGFVMVNKRAKNILGIETSRLIAVNVTQSYYAKRWTIARMLAHYMLSDSPNRFAYREKISEISSNDNAEYFALCLLMPEERFKLHFKMHNTKSIHEKCSNLSKIFKVPIEKVLNRIDDLKLTF